MYICVCKAVTDHEICEAVTQRAITTLGCLARETGACTQCGKCARAARDVMQNCLQEPAVHRNILTNHFEEAAAA